MSTKCSELCLWKIMHIYYEQMDGCYYIEFPEYGLGTIMVTKEIALFLAKKFKKLEKRLSKQLSKAIEKEREEKT